MLTNYHVTLTPEERRELEAMIGRGRSSARTLVRARVLLKCDEGDGGPTAGRRRPAARRPGRSSAARPRRPAFGSGSSKKDWTPR